MAAPLYFFARRQLGDVVRDDRLLPSVLRESKLADTLADVTSAQQCCVNEITTHGPGGASGVLLTVLPASGETPKRVGFAPDFQIWKQASKSPDGSGKDLWIGVDREHPPTPADLLRRTASRVAGEMRAPHSGYQITLADGLCWTVPVIRRPPLVERHGLPLTALPRDLGWDLEGKFVETLKAEYQALWEDTAGLIDLFYESADDPARTAFRQGLWEMSIEDGLRWALRILGLNYRYGFHEQNLLRAVDRSSVFLVLGAAVDTPLVGSVLQAEAQKKTATAMSSPPGTASISPGPAGG